jgi:PAS domain S-box-containing protein
VERDSSSDVRRLLLAGLLIVAAYGAGVWAIGISPHNEITAAWWPAAGLGVMATLWLPRRWWPLLFVGLFLAYSLANVTGGRPWVAASLLGLADIVETILVAVLVTRFVGRRMKDVVDVWKLFAIAALGSVVAATGIAATSAGLLGGSFWSTLQVTAPSHACSVMLLTPVALTSWLHRRTTIQPLELAAQAALLFTTTLVTFGPSQDLTVGFAPLPLLVWAAVRFDVRVVVLEQVLFATVVTLYTRFGWGPFNQGVESQAPGSSTQAAQLYLICVVLIGLPLAKAMSQRARALVQLSTSERTFRRNFTESRVPVAIVCRTSGELSFAECNDATVELLGRSSVDLAGHRVTELLSSPDLEDAAGAIVAGERAGWSGPIGVAAEPRTRLDGTLSLIEELEDSATFSLHLVDVTKPQEMQERLEAERNYTRAVIDTASSMIVLTRLDGTVIAANPATTALTGFSEEDLVGQPLWELLMSGSQRERSAAMFANPDRLTRSGEAQLQTKDGDQRAVVFSSATHRVSEDAPVTVVVSATDVTAARHNAGMVDHLLRSARTIAFVGTDTNGRVTLFNTGAEEMLGVSAETATGREFVEFMAADDLARYGAICRPDQTTFEAIVDNAAEDLTPETRDWTWLPAGRPPLQVSMTTNPVTDTFGDLFGYLFVANDITDTRRSQEILVKALRREREVVSRLKDLDRVKDDFVTTVSHELRTPMSSIIGSAEMLADGLLGALEPEQEKMIDVISRNGDRLLALADDLLLLATFDQSAWPEQMADVDLRSVVEESANGVASMLKTRDLDIGYSLPAQPVLVHGDAIHLERAVTNLLTNAVKFTDDGGHVHVAVVADHSTGTALLTVSDTGIGIDESDLDQVFGRFFRSENVQERAIQGTGLGLAIVKTIVEGHDGHIDVLSDPGTGTTFTITFPIVKAPVSRRPSTVATVPLSRG